MARQETNCLNGFTTEQIITEKSYKLSKSEERNCEKCSNFTQVEPGVFMCKILYDNTTMGV